MKKLMKEEKYESMMKVLQKKVDEYNLYLRVNVDIQHIKNFITFSNAMEFKQNPNENTLNLFLKELCSIYDVPMNILINNSIITYCDDKIFVTTKPYELLKKKSSVIIKRTTKDDLETDPIHILSTDISKREYKKVLKQL